MGCELEGICKKVVQKSISKIRSQLLAIKSSFTKKRASGRILKTLFWLIFYARIFIQIFFLSSIYPQCSLFVYIALGNIIICW